MFSDLFKNPEKKAKKTAAVTKPKKPKNPKKPKKEKDTVPVPSAAQQTTDYAPFDHVVEESPEATQAETLEYDIIEDELGSAWDEEECMEDSDAGSEINYEATSIADETEQLCGSITSSPGFMYEHRSVKVEKKRPPGISITFDDDSWID